MIYNNIYTIKDRDTKIQRDKKTKRQRDEETKRRKKYDIIQMG